MDIRSEADCYQGLVSRSVQATAAACTAWLTGDWTEGAYLILRAADFEAAAAQQAPLALHPPAA